MCFFCVFVHICVRERMKESQKETVGGKDRQREGKIENKEKNIEETQVIDI